jgi:hypothetical protein
MNEIWTLVNGAWGDFFACYGNICKILEQRNLDKSNVIYYGLDPDIKTALKKQNNVDKVVSLDISNPELYFKYAGLAACDFSEWLRVTGLDQQFPEIIPTHISRYYNIENPTECNRIFQINIPDPLLDWSPFFNLYNPYIIVQPFSCHSCTFDKHWPFWMEALEWILENTNKKVVLIGQLMSRMDHRFKFPWIEHPNLLNLVDQTPSMMDVYHLMNKASYVITTSNSLSMYSIITNKPSLVVCNQIIKEMANYYYNWIHYKPNHVLDCNVSLAEFKDCFKFFDVASDQTR